MQVDVTQQEAATLLTFLQEYDLMANTAEGRIVLDIVDKLQPIANAVPQTA